MVTIPGVEKLQTIRQIENFQFLKRFEIFDTLYVRRNGNFAGLAQFVFFFAKKLAPDA